MEDHVASILSLLSFPPFQPPKVNQAAANTLASRGRPESNFDAAVDIVQRAIKSQKKLYRSPFGQFFILF
jgi:hypothetical protein